jgi:hypothetical protein
MDGEFCAPWLLSELDRQGKTFMIDQPGNARVYKRNPRLSWRSKTSSRRAPRLKQRPVLVRDFVLKQGNRPWRQIAFRDSSKGPMIAEVLHRRVWFWDGEKESMPRRMHLLIRRTPKENGLDWNYKYSLSNAPHRTTIQRLVYQQAQRFWVEQSIRDCKMGLGLDEYQVRKWRAWHHHVALTLLAGLYCLKMRLQNREAMPLLSITDVREVLAFLLPQKLETLQDLLSTIRKRHHVRYRSYQTAKMRHGPPKKAFVEPFYPQVTK